MNPLTPPWPLFPCVGNKTNEGDMEDKGFLPGIGKLSAEGANPKKLEAPGMEKSSI